MVGPLQCVVGTQSSSTTVDTSAELDDLRGGKARDALVIHR